ARDADREHATLAVQVAERAPDQDQRAERQQVAVDHPLLCRETPAQRALDRRQGDVHDRSVEQRDPRADDRGDKRQALERCVAAGGHTLTNGSPSRRGPARRRTAAAKRGGELCQQRTFDRYTVVPSDEVCRRTSSIKILISASPRPCSA